MQDYILFTDCACDISPKLLAQWEVPFVSMTVKFDDEEESFQNFDRPFRAFYEKMRKGGVARTAAVNAQTFLEAFEPCLKAGKDVLYLAFSSGLSTTYNSALIALEELRERYPERRLIAVDSLAASAGFGLFVYLVKRKRDEGASIEEAAAYAESIKLNVCHWFTVDDLVYLKRGGRVSAAAALVGGLLNIKPVLHTDNEGHLINMFKVRGRRAAIKALAQKYGELALDPAGGTLFISHGDCIEDAKLLKKIIMEDYGVNVALITDIGPVIGSHSGPGTLAFFFLGKER